jgi:Xaa-Pro dipeptidase
METMKDKTDVASFRVPREEIERRVARVQKKMLARDVEALFVVQRVDLFYFSGTAQNGCLFIPAEGKPVLLVKKYYPRASEESPLDNIVSIQSIREVPDRITEYHGSLPSRLGFEWDVMPVREFRFYQGLFAGVECVDGSSIIHDVRAIKSPWEVARIEAAAEKSSELLDFIGKHLNAGISDVNISSWAESFARAIGHGAALRIRDYQKSGLTLHQLSRDGMGAAKSLADPWVREGNCLAIEPQGRLTKERPITLEARFFLNGYHVTEARIFSIGVLPFPFNDGARRLMELHREILDEIKPGVRADLLSERSREKRGILGINQNAQSPGTAEKNFIGNGIGLELVEPPLITDGNHEVLRQGILLSVSSASRVDGHYPMRIKDVVLVTETGCRTITRLSPQVFIVP